VANNCVLCTSDQFVNASWATSYTHSPPKADVSCNGTAATFTWLLIGTGSSAAPTADDIVLDEIECSEEGLCQQSATLTSAHLYDAFYVRHTDGSYTKIQRTFYCWAGVCCVSVCSLLADL